MLANPPLKEVHLKIISSQVGSQVDDPLPANNMTHHKEVQPMFILCRGFFVGDRFPDYAAIIARPAQQRKKTTAPTKRPNGPLMCGHLGF
jgi:hypothetical protein